MRRVTEMWAVVKQGRSVQRCRVPMPEPRSGDLLAIFSTGAYNYSMASNYNRYPRPPVVFVRDGKARVVVERETVEDLLAKDVPPA